MLKDEPLMEQSQKPYHEIICTSCHAKKSAVKTYFDDAGEEWQSVCFTCGEVIYHLHHHETRSKLRHKCMVRFTLG